MHTSGGRVSTVIGGVAYSARGVIKLSPSNMSVSAGVNQDGSLFRNVAPKARTAEITFDRWLTDANGQPMKWNEDILKLTNLGITFVEQDTDVTHVMSGGFFVGDPSMDTSTGEVDGLSLAADSYKTI